MPVGVSYLFDNGPVDIFVVTALAIDVGPMSVARSPAVSASGSGSNRLINDSVLPDI